jgi:hypothetical protein
MMARTSVLTFFVLYALAIAAQDSNARLDHLRCPSTLLGVFEGADLVISGRAAEGRARRS